MKTGVTERLPAGEASVMLRGMKALIWSASAGFCLLFCTQCAQVQTYKQVRELGTVYRGYDLGSSDAVWQQGDQYYICCEQRDFTISPPLINDSVLLPDLYTSYTLKPQATCVRAYHPISKDTAFSLTQTNGFDMMSRLNAEISAGENVWIAAEHFPVASARRIPITADMGTKEHDSADHVVIEETVSEMSPALNWTLTALDAIIIDIPATIFYNGLFPITAPAAVFRESAQPNPL